MREHGGAAAAKCAGRMHTEMLLLLLFRRVHTHAHTHMSDRAGLLLPKSSIDGFLGEASGVLLHHVTVRNVARRRERGKEGGRGR